MMPGLPVSSIPQCKLNRHEGTCLESFHAICRFKPVFIEAHQALKIIGKVLSHKSRRKTCSCLEEIMIWSNDMFKDCVSDFAVEIRKQSNSTRATAKTINTAKQIAGASILTPQLQGK
jgi:hypothetical protein